MSRLMSEPSAAYAPLDIATTPGRKAGIDPSLIGAFDEALRRANQADREPLARMPAAPPESHTAAETKSPTEMRTSTTTNDREDREAAKSASSEDDIAPVSDRESSDGEEIDEADPGTGQERVSHETEDDRIVDDSTTSDETVGEGVTESPVALPMVIQEAEAPPADLEATDESGGAERSLEPGKKASVEPPTGAIAEEAVAVRRKGEATAEGAAPAPELMDESLAPTPPGFGAEAETTGQKATEGENPQSIKLSKDVEGENRLAFEGSTSAGGENSAEQAPPSEETTQKRSRPCRGERRDSPETVTNESEPIPARTGQTDRTAATAMAEPIQPPAGTTDSSTPSLEAVAADPAATDRGIQPTAAVDAVPVAEPRVAAAQRQANAGSATTKGTGADVDPGKFVQRVANAFSAMGQRSGPVRLKLYPPELGSLRMEITVRNGSLSARVEAETDTARNLLLEHLPVLRERLAEQGIKVERFDVGVSDQSSGGPSESPNDSGRSSRDRQNDLRRQTSGNDTDLPEPIRTRQPAADGRLDIFI